MNKVLAKRAFIQAGIKTPRWQILPGPNRDLGLLEDPTSYATRITEDIFHSFPGPWIVKPIAGGSSIGVYMVQSYPELISTLAEIFEGSGDDLLLEEFIEGKEATCGVLEQFRGHELFALPPVEIIPPQASQFFDYTAKYSGETREICPGNFSLEERRALERLAQTVHRALSLRHYSRTDFIVSRHGIYTLEVNTLPGLTETSLLPKSLGALGVGLDTFLERIITLALKRPG